MDIVFAGHGCVRLPPLILLAVTAYRKSSGIQSWRRVLRMDVRLVV